MQRTPLSAAHGIIFVAGTAAAFACLFAMPVSAAPAAGAPTPQAAPGGHSILSPDDPNNKLHLTADQQKTLWTIGDKARSDYYVIVNNPKLTQQQKQAKSQSLLVVKQQEELAVMNPAQQQQVKRAWAVQASYQKGIVDLNNKMTQMQQQFRSTVTPDQLKKQQAIRTSMQQYATELSKDKTLTDDQRRKKFTDKFDPQIKSLFTPSQKQMMSKIASMQQEMASLQQLYRDAAI